VILLIGLGGFGYWAFFGTPPWSSPSSPSGPSGTDTTAPAISSIAASAATDNATGKATVVITWQTDEPATSQVEYGKDTSYGFTTEIEHVFGEGTSGVITHMVTITDLDPNSTYHYRVKSQDEAQNLKNSEDKEFTTPP
jgi:hypothetical protein